MRAFNVLECVHAWELVYTVLACLRKHLCNPPASAKAQKQTSVHPVSLNIHMALESAPSSQPGLSCTFPLDNFTNLSVQLSYEYPKT